MSPEKCALVVVSVIALQLQLLKHAIIGKLGDADQLEKPFTCLKSQCWYTHCSPRITRTGPSFILAHALSTVVQSTSLAGHSRAISVTVSKLSFLDNWLTNSALRCKVSEIKIKARTTAQVLPCLLNNACPHCFTLRQCPQFNSKTSTRAKVNQNTHSGPNDFSQDENFYTCLSYNQKQKRHALGFQKRCALKLPSKTNFSNNGNC